LLSDDLTAGLAAAEEGHDLVAHIDLAEEEPALAPALLAMLGHDADVGDLAGRGGVAGVGPTDHGDVLVEVELLDQVGLAAMHVDRAAMCGAVSAGGVHG